MCLDRILPEKPEPKGRGWKVFLQVREYKREGSYLATIPNQYWPGVVSKACPYDVGVWYNANESYTAMKMPYRILYTEYGYTLDKVPYEAGFHVALDRADAEDFISRHPGDIIKEVEYEDARVLGLGSPSFFGGRQVVAQRMRILPDSEASK